MSHLKMRQIIYFKMVKEVILISDFKGDVIPNPHNKTIIGYYDSKNLLHIIIESKAKDFDKISRRGIAVYFERIDIKDRGCCSEITV